MLYARAAGQPMSTSQRGHHDLANMQRVAFVSDAVCMSADHYVWHAKKWPLCSNNKMRSMSAMLLNTAFCSTGVRQVHIDRDPACAVHSQGHPLLAGAAGLQGLLGMLEKKWPAWRA